MNNPSATPSSAIETVVIPRTADLGDGFHVRRALPSAQRRMVGPFVFFDQMGPALLQAGHGLDVRPHPHIGLATVTYLFDGEILHRDSLGSVQPIRPGELNWMTAGRGIVHSERTPVELRARASTVSGIQAWVALPRAHEEAAPAFVHHARAALPLLADTGYEARLIAGRFDGAQSPAQVLSEMFYADVVLREGGRFRVPAEHVERAAYVIDGQIGIGGDGDAAPFGQAQLIVFAPGREIVVEAVGGPARVMLFGGEPMDGPRHLWWNFVSSSNERIEQAKADWKAGRFDAVPQESEFIPLPEAPPRPVDSA
jgi:redox-sensitive bicupin YhaK (pirin superfamily)